MRFSGRQVHILTIGGIKRASAELDAKYRQRVDCATSKKERSFFAVFNEDALGAARRDVPRRQLRIGQVQAMYQCTCKDENDNESFFDMACIRLFSIVPDDPAVNNYGLQLVDVNKFEELFFPTLLLGRSSYLFPHPDARLPLAHKDTSFLQVAMVLAR